LVRTESVASSKIEGLQIGNKRLAEAMYAETGDQLARSVQSNIDAMHRAIALADQRRPLTAQAILEIHAVLAEGTHFQAHAGVLREEPSWIGGNNEAPIDAEFIGPPWEEVPRLTDDLVAFLNRDDMPALLQAAIAHAQFETIHPFADGNGRVGRCLIHVILRRRGLAATFVPPISVVLAARPREYVAGLEAYRAGDREIWCKDFARAARLAALKGEQLVTRFRALETEWIERAGSPRKGSTALKVIHLLPGQPILDVSSAARALGVSEVAARNALTQLALSDVIRLRSVRRWRRAYVAPEVWETLDAFEHDLRTTIAELETSARSAEGTL
jgi:Fic family protein